MARSGATISKTGVILSAPKIGATQDEEAAARPDAAAGDSGAAPPGARDLHRKLDEAFAPPPAPEAIEDGAEAADAPAPRRAWSLAFRRSVKILAALALIAFFGAGPLKTLLQAASVEAVVNSRIVTIRSPIDGEIVAAPRDATAWSAVKGAPVLHIVDPKADRGRLDDMRRALGRAEDERIGTEARLEQARATLAALEKQTGQFTTGRVSQLEARLAALRSDLAAASARSEEAKASLDRLTSITRPGVVSGADLARVRRDQLVAAETEQAARHRIEEASIELAAARNGSFLGDSYNDRPSSAQRADEVRQRIGDLTANLASRAAEIGRLRGELAAEEARFRNLSDVEIAMPVSGRVWEVMASPGEQVRRGQDLIRILDCSTAVVTANVAEAVYNRLKIGSPATFHPSDSGESFDGVVVNLTGMSGAPANFAIQPHALLKEAYHVTVSVPRLAETGGCAVGRTGRVVFGAQPDGVQAEAAPFGLRR
ncbi:MAG: hypothetical protein BGP06_20625 [Rhizobiales bacterium 65-9]|nr:HlyD family efflux transporter periplasmic adaptor subunit [Hyphomicrobiales bacterium]OJY36596.1 MAG: hypothetical protein BGP06_20625 [Rhizobiales bacterium 65-9]